MQINQFLEQSAQKYPEKPAVWFKDEWLTYREIDKAANQLANYLVQIGMRREDRIALLMENSFDYVIAYYAILKAGGIVVALNTDTNSESLVYLLSDSGAKCIIAQKKFSRHIIAALAEIKTVNHLITDQHDLKSFESIDYCQCHRLCDIYEESSPEHPMIRCIDIDLAAFVYTSGSTGKPKGVMLTHLNIVANTRSIVQYLELTDNDRIMVVLPFFYIYGMSLMNTHFFCGGSLVLDNRFAFPNVILETMKKTGTTGLSGVPSTFMILLNKSTVKKEKFPALRYVTQAGGALAPNIQKMVAEVFAPAKLFIMYGATEASARLSYVPPEWLPRKWGSIGKAIPMVEMYIADPDGNRLPQGTEGEIVARGLNIMQGYWNDQAATDEVLKHGLYYTGDIGVMDEDGFIKIVGRKKDMIKVGGQRVSSKEIEEVMLTMEDIHEAAVIGVPDEYLGEAITSFVVPADGVHLSEKQVQAFCKKHLPSYKVPKSIIFLPALPKNESGKIQKLKLTEFLNIEK